MRLVVKRLILCGLLCGLCIPFSGCDKAMPGVAENGAPRLVLLYVTCSLNKFFLSPYDPNVAYTPSLDRFAKSGLVFERHQTEAGQSGVSFATLFSGTQATEHGIFRHPTRLPDETFLITEAFAAAGYDTFAWLDHRMASVELNYAQGVPADQAFDARLLAGDARFAKILDRLAADPDYKALIVVNFTVTHGPYPGKLIDEFCSRYPDECGARVDEIAFEADRKRYRESFLDWSYDFHRTAADQKLDRDAIRRFASSIELLYKADVHLLDRMFGEILDDIARRDLTRESLIAFTVDHGEIHYRENAQFFWTHGWQLAPEVLDVAFLVRGPGVRVGTHEGVTRSVDVFPTLAGLAGVELPEIEGLGVDLAPSIHGDDSEPTLLGFSHTSLFTDEVWRRYKQFPPLDRLYDQEDPDLIWTAVREGDLFFRLTRPTGEGWEMSAFDLAVDRQQTRNLFDPASAIHRERRRQLEEYRSRIATRFRRDDGESKIEAERSIEMLRALGYIE